MRWARSLQLVWLVTMVAACAGQTPAGDIAPLQAPATLSPEEALRARATALWEARVKGDMITEYRLLEPGGREQMTLTGFARARESVNFLSYAIEEVEVAEDLGQVKAQAKFKVKVSIPRISGLGPYDRSVYTRWVLLRDGLWYLKADQQDAGKPLKAETGPS